MKVRVALPTALQGQPRVALPEAAASDGSERVPDLGTALRRHPDVRTLHVVGDGLEARDRDALGKASDALRACAAEDFVARLEVLHRKN